MKYRILSISAAFVFIFAINGTAQSFTSTAQLKLACETSAGNVVTLTNNTQISSGPQAPATENVDTKCTININPNVKFEASQVSMTFAGPLRFQGGNEADVLFIESEFNAPSITVAQTDKSLFQVERSLLRATSGNIAYSSGAEGFFQINGPLVGGNLVATGAIIASGGLKFQADLTDAELSAGTGINFSLTGNEGQFVATTTSLSAQNGAINVTGSGEKSFAEFKFNSFVASPRGVNIRLNGNESEINANQFTFDGGTGVTILTRGNKGKVTLALGTIESNSSVTIQSSISGLEGVAVVQNARIAANGGNLRIETGSRGNTEVKDSSLTSTNIVRIATGSGGSCKSQQNVFNAPTLQICQ